MVRIASAQQSSFSLSNIVKARYSEGRIAVPVSQSLAPYARFKHISGVPSPKGGYPLSKLKTLDILIDRLKRIKGEAFSTSEKSEVREADQHQLDAMIQEYSRKLHQAFIAAESNPYLPAGSSGGITLSLEV